MQTKSINVEALEALIARETAKRDDSPEHTLDWYTFDNRVSLLKEVEDCIIITPRKEATPKPKKVKDEVEVETKEQDEVKEEKSSKAKTSK